MNSLLILSGLLIIIIIILLVSKSNFGVGGTGAIVQRPLRYVVLTASNKVKYAEIYDIMLNTKRVLFKIPNDRTSKIISTSRDLLIKETFITDVSNKRLYPSSKSIKMLLGETKNNTGNTDDIVVGYSSYLTVDSDLNLNKYYLFRFSMKKNTMLIPLPKPGVVNTNFYKFTYNNNMSSEEYNEAQGLKTWVNFDIFKNYKNNFL
jgi:hypothetical protein